MARPKKIKETEPLASDYAGVAVIERTLDPIIEHFNIGDLNTLRDKINEIIQIINER